jgi:hypothetical protein
LTGVRIAFPVRTDAVRSWHVGGADAGVCDVCLCECGVCVCLYGKDSCRSTEPASFHSGERRRDNSESGGQLRESAELRCGLHVCAWEKLWCRSSDRDRDRVRARALLCGALMCLACGRSSGCGTMRTPTGFTSAPQRATGGTKTSKALGGGQLTATTQRSRRLGSRSAAGICCTPLFPTTCEQQRGAGAGIATVETACSGHPQQDRSPPRTIRHY